MLEFDKVYGGKYLLIGDDRNGNLLEILYNVIDEDSINVFHALKCRSMFFPLLPGGVDDGGND